MHRLSTLEIGGMTARKEAVRLAIFIVFCCVTSVCRGQPLTPHDIEVQYAIPTTRHYNWNVALAPRTVNCFTKDIVVVNGEFPGPTIYAVTGDRIIVNVTNNANADLTIHWHGVKQILTGWQDGAGHITQCPMKQGDYFVYNFTVTGQQGTLFWHAHVNWLRATVHGAIVIFPPTFTYPHAKPDEEFNVILGDWWNGDVDATEREGLQQFPFNFALADALLINGRPGSRYNCSDTEGIPTLKVSTGRTYLLRIINAGLNSEEFFGIAYHRQTIVEIDGEYVKPVDFDTVFLSPGQTMNVLIYANQRPGTYYMEAAAYTSLVIPNRSFYPPLILEGLLNDIPKISSTALLQYDSAPTLDPSTTFWPGLPAENDTAFVTSFLNSLKVLDTSPFPTKVDRYLLFTVGLVPPPGLTGPQGPQGPSTGVVSDIKFILPKIDLLQAYYNKTQGIYSTDFPDFPENQYDYTNGPPQNFTNGTRISVIEYGAVVELVLQGTWAQAYENHPFHLHGYNFYVLASGMGNYDSNTSPSTFNNVDPPSRFTVEVPAGGWVAIRFKADNPGMWFMHCHLEKHTSWGMEMAFLVKDGAQDNEKLVPPPDRLTACPA